MAVHDFLFFSCAMFCVQEPEIVRKRFPVACGQVLLFITVGSFVFTLFQALSKYSRWPKYLKVTLGVIRGGS
jgi:hypothetical protein